jgi:hypothetical protein
VSLRLDRAAILIKSGRMEIRIITARNKALNGRAFTIDEDGLARLGRTTYTLAFDCYQPNKLQGDFTLIDYTIDDMKPFRLMRTDTTAMNKGIWIEVYEIATN